MTLTVNSVPGATGYKWYSTPTGGTPIATTATGTYQTASLTYTTPYYVSAYNAAGESASRYAMQAIIKPQVTFPGATALAMGQSVTLQAPAGYDSYAWKNAQASTIGTAQTMEISTAGTYTLEATKSSLMTASEPIVITSAVSGQNRNYIVSTTIKVPGITDPAQIETLTVQQRAQQIQYFDGLGRPMQTVVTMGSPTMQDIISPVEYDAFGRQAKQHLPYTLASTAPGTYDASWAANQAATYNTLQAGETTLYAETRFEASPLNRVLEQAAPGDAWKMSTGKTVKFSYQINTAADEVRLWKIANNLPTSSGFYPTGQLYKNVTTDEDGNQSMEFVDKQGRTVLKRVQVDATTYADTYYIYDIYGLKRVVWQPQGVQELKDNNWEVTPLRLKNWAFTYQYDGRNREIARQVPGADTVYTVYDRWDRVVLTQDGNQRTRNEYLFTKYDGLNRPVMTGIWENTDDLQTVRDAVKDSTNRYETFDSQLAATMGYTNTAFPSQDLDYLTVTYYDDYAHRMIAGQWPIELDYSFFDFEHPTYALPAAIDYENPRVKGRVTGTKTKNLQTGQWINTAMYYDDKYRVVQTVANNIRGDFDVNSTLYDFVGQVLQTNTLHMKGEAESMDIRRTFTYDHAGRLLHTTHQIDDQPDVTLAANSYNELSQLTTKGLHAGAETVAYDYNIRGWLTSINSVLFSQQLYYNTVANGLNNTPLYNGNISAQRWSDFNGTGMNPTRAYKYSYDHMNRLLAAQHFENNSTTNNYSTGYGYDLNGNMLGLLRHGATGSVVDSLVYGYAGNRLMRVKDTSENDEIFKDGNTSGDDYNYDENGNLSEDKNKEIVAIKYNYLNLNEKVVFANGDSILYFYDAAGIKLRQESYKGGILKIKRDYIGDFYYENDTLKYIYHDEGRVVLKHKTGEIDHQYVIRDHLGNSRVTFSTLPEKYTFKATMEDANAETEEAYFTNIPETRVSMAAANQTVGGSKAARVESTDPIGPMTMLGVNKGDTVRLSAYAYYEGDGSTDGLISEAAVLAALLAGYGNATGLSEVPSSVEAALDNGLNFPNNLIPKANQTNDDAPKAYINYMYFDEDMNFITSGFKQISTAAQFQKELVEMEPIIFDRNGYVMVYVSNESNELNYVHFDDFKIVHSKTNIIQTDDYMPFGVAINSFSRSHSEPNRFKYNGKEVQEELGAHTLDYGARMYMADIGRFGGIDDVSVAMPLWSPFSYVFNNPIRFIDPDGNIPYDKTVSNYSRISHYGERIHPRSGKKKFHQGTDLITSYGTSINSFASGTVVKVGKSDSWGNYIVIDHGQGYYSLYAHIEDGDVLVREGEMVRDGENIGKVGSKGESTGPHLHLEVGEAKSLAAFISKENRDETRTDAAKIGDLEKFLHPSSDKGYTQSSKRKKGEVVSTTYTNTGTNEKSWAQLVQELFFSFFTKPEDEDKK